MNWSEVDFRSFVEWIEARIAYCEARRFRECDPEMQLYWKGRITSYEQILVGLKRGDDSEEACW